MITKAAKRAIDKLLDGEVNSLTTEELDEIQRDGEKYLGVLGVGTGAYLGDKALASGDLTGRETLYHGTDVDSAANIKRTGLMPTTDANAINTTAIKSDTERYNKSLGKSYTTRNKGEARTYAIQTQAKRDALKGKVPDGIRLALQSGKGIVKLNVPTWKRKTVINPEVDMPFDDWRKKLGIFGALYPESVLKKMYNSLRESVVFEGGIPTEYIKGSDGYKGLSAAELLDFIRNNPQRFVKGLGKAGLGAGLVGGGGYLLGRQYLEDDAS